MTLDENETIRRGDVCVREKEKGKERDRVREKGRERKKSKRERGFPENIWFTGAPYIHPVAF